MSCDYIEVQKLLHNPLRMDKLAVCLFCRSSDIMYNWLCPLMIKLVRKKTEVGHLGTVWECLECGLLYSPIAVLHCVR